MALMIVVAVLGGHYVCRSQRCPTLFTARPAAAACRPDLDVVVSTQLHEGLVQAFGHNGYTPAELAQVFADGGQALALMAGGQLVSVGMIYRNFAYIWGIAGLFTTPAARRQGYAARIVRTAVHLLHQRGYTPRYVVDAANTPSITLAETVGLKRFLTVIHYAASGRRAIEAPPGDGACTHSAKGYGD